MYWSLSKKCYVLLIPFGAKTRQNVVTEKIQLRAEPPVRRIKKTPMKRSTGVSGKIEENGRF